MDINVYDTNSLSIYNLSVNIIYKIAHDLINLFIYNGNKIFILKFINRLSIYIYNFYLNQPK